ncbi:MAG: hypothetical protein JO345_14125 [Streptosporangiaceae bacterium]|nr:hypothetical protein [Streptosporangiaceae bacterium]
MAIRAARTSGKSAVMAGPSSGPIWPAAGPVISVRYVIRVRAVRCQDWASQDWA